MALQRHCCLQTAKQHFGAKPGRSHPKIWWQRRAIAEGFASKGLALGWLQHLQEPRKSLVPPGFGGTFPSPGGFSSCRLLSGGHLNLPGFIIANK